MNENLTKKVDDISLIGLGKHEFGVIFKYALNKNVETAPLSLAKNKAPYDRGTTEDINLLIAKGEAEEHCVLRGLNYYDLLLMRNEIDSFLKNHNNRADSIKRSMKVKEDA